MAPKPSRPVILLSVLGVLLLVLWYRNMDAGPPAVVLPLRGAAVAAPTQQLTVAVPDVRLAELEQPRPVPLEDGRNPFSMRPTPPPPPPPEPGDDRGGPGDDDAADDGNVPPVPTEPPPPPPPPPIPLKFIGVVNPPGSSTRFAVLTDGRGVFHGKDGDIIEGRFRIVRIGEESIEMEYLDGRGRQTIRLSGS